MEYILIIMLVGAFSFSAWWDTVWIAGIGFIIYMAVNFIFTDMSHMAFLMNWMNMLAFSVFSLAVGAMWSLWKWRKWMKSDWVQKHLREAKTNYDTGSQSLQRGITFKDSENFPSLAKPSQNVERIISWIVLWPFSIIIYFFEDFLMDIGRWIYNKLGKVYVRITDSALPEDMR